MASVNIETSIISYLTARPSCDLRAAAWQQLTCQWWNECRPVFELFTSELVVVEASAGSPESAQRRIDVLKGIDELLIDPEVERLADRLVHEGAVPESAQADAFPLHWQRSIISIIFSLGTAVISIMRPQSLLYARFALKQGMLVRKSARRLSFLARRQTMYSDEILREVWRNRDDYVEKHHHSLKEIVADMLSRQKDPNSKIVDRRVLYKQYNDNSKRS